MPQILPQEPVLSAEVVAWGFLDYALALDRQRELWQRRVRGEGRDTIAIVEHPAVVTLGRHAPSTDILASEAALRQQSIAVVRSDRGGRATYHGPGQAVVYPIVAIGARGIGVKSWVDLLESALLQTLDSFGIHGLICAGRPGAWVQGKKIASIGLRISRGVSYHGVSLNVDKRALDGFAHIVTCGMAGQPVTSLADELGGDASAVRVENVAARFANAVVHQLSNCDHG